MGGRVGERADHNRSPCRRDSRDSRIRAGSPLLFKRCSCGPDGGQPELLPPDEGTVVRHVRALGATFLALLLGLAVGCGGNSASTPAPSLTTTSVTRATAGDWTRFGFDAARTNAVSRAGGITPDNVGTMQAQRVELPGTVDSSPIYLRAVEVAGARRDVFVVTTSYGKALAVDADTGRLLWTYVPPGIEEWEGTSQITQASPVADPDRRFVYSVSPDGRVHKLSLADGSEVRSGEWPAVVTKDPQHEKTGTALNLRAGAIVNVFNTLCSDRHELIEPSSCSESGSAIWGRAGAVVEPSTGKVLVATGNGQ